MSRLALIVDDEAFVRDSLAEMLDGEGYETVLAASASEAVARATQHAPNVVITDLKMPETTGVELIGLLREAGVEAPVIVVTGAGSVTDAVEAMKVGAFDFLLKPVDPEQLLVQLERAIEHGRLVDEVGFLRRVARGRPMARGLVGGSRAMEEVRRAITQVAPTDAPVLLTGESGTGKEVAAEMIHRSSLRKDGPYVTVNCAAIPDTLFESECFGHVRGAFSGASADRRGRFAEAESGTLFLDELGTLDLDLQAKLLRVLETGEYQVVGDSTTQRADVRIVAATNEDLRACCEAGTFREDLFFRLSVFPVELPPLRDHLEDLDEISEELVLRSRHVGAASSAAPDLRLSPDAIQVLEGYHWPGNVRELRNVLERATILAGGATPRASLLRDILEPSMRSVDGTPLDDAPDGLSLRENLDRVERELVQRALERADGVKKEAARLLGIDPRNLAYYLRKHLLNDDPEKR